MNQTPRVSARRGQSVPKALLFVALAALTIGGCGKKVAELENQVAQLEQERDELQQYVSDQDQHAIDIANSVDEVLTRVTEITARQGRLRVEAHQAELGSSGDVTAARNSILEEVEWLDGQLEENRARLAELTEQVAALEGSGQRQTTRIVQLEKMISTQELLMTDLRADANRLEARSAELVAEKVQVEEEKVAVTEELEQLAEVHDDLRERYDTLEDDVGRGYVFIGDKKRIKELKKLDILQDRGKVVVAGSGLESAQADDHFRAVSVVAREIRLGPVSERVEVLSPHREQGQNFWFERKGDDLYLMLRDPGRFWNASHYLVLRER
jgi:predicted nuclease with TOPRIM domain